ncbi:trace amine-associated receptor 3 [Biomphalaria glabrata]|nr:trace amine-associated receptor 3 [Biomphalaria glabrata]
MANVSVTLTKDNVTSLITSVTSIYIPVSIYSGSMIFISVFGIVGNSISIAVLRRHNLAATSNLLLMTLCSNDLLVCLLTFTMYGSTLLGDVALDIKSGFLKSFQNTVYFFSFIVENILIIHGLILTTSIAIERLIAVCFPFHVTRIFSSFRVKCFIVIIYLVIFIMAIPFYLRYTIELNYSNEFNCTIVVYIESVYFISHKEIFEAYLVSVFSNIIIITCLSTIVVSTIVIIVKIVWRKFQNFTTNDSRRRSMNQSRIVKMLLTMCSITFLSYSTNATLEGIIVNIDLEFFIYIFPLFRTLTNVIYLINPTTNFIIFICMSSKFRSHFIIVLFGFARRCKLSSK